MLDQMMEKIAEDAYYDELEKIAYSPKVVQNMIAGAAQGVKPAHMTGGGKAATKAAKKVSRASSKGRKAVETPISEWAKAKEGYKNIPELIKQKEYRQALDAIKKGGRYSAALGGGGLLGVGGLGYGGYKAVSD